MPKEIDVLKDVSKRLTFAGIKYMLTGSFAMNYYAEPRMTRDIDIVIEADMKDAHRLVTLFDPEYYVPRGAVAQALTHESLFNIIHTRDIVKIDLIIRKNSEYRRLEFERRQQVEIQDLAIWIVTKEDLIIPSCIGLKIRSRNCNYLT